VRSTALLFPFSRFRVSTKWKSKGHAASDEPSGVRRHRSIFLVFQVLFLLAREKGAGQIPCLKIAFWAVPSQPMGGLARLRSPFILRAFFAYRLGRPRTDRGTHVFRSLTACSSKIRGKLGGFAGTRFSDGSRILAAYHLLLGEVLTGSSRNFSSDLSTALRAFFLPATRFESAARFGSGATSDGYEHSCGKWPPLSRNS
jgi:hypothetical protein